MQAEILNVIEEFIGDECKRSNQMWIKLVSLSLLSAAVGNTCTIGVKGSMNLSIFGFHVAPSRIGNKSIVLKICARPIMRKLSELIETELRLPSKFSSEKLTKILCGSKGGEKGKDTEGRGEGIMFVDEFTSMFKSSRSSSYQPAMEYLSFLADGLMEISSTFARGTTEDHEVCVNALFATTPFVFSIMNQESFFLQGLGNRMLFVFSDELDNNVHYAIGELLSDGVKENEMINEIATRLKLIRERFNKNIGFTHDADVMLIAYQESRESTGIDFYNQNKHDIFYAYIATLPSFVKKLAALHAINRCDASGAFLIINEDDMEKAINDVNMFYQHYERLVDAWSRNIKKKEPMSNELFYRQILSVLRSEGGITTQSRINSITQLGYHELLPHLQELHRQGVIVIRPPNNGEWKARKKRGPVPKQVIVFGEVSKV